MKGRGAGPPLARGGRRPATRSLLASIVQNRVKLTASRMLELREQATGLGLEVRQDALYFDGRRLVPEAEVDTVLRCAYAAPHVSGAVGRDQFHRMVAKRHIGISCRAVLAFLKRQQPWQLQQPIYRIPHTTSRPWTGPFEKWQADLLDVGPTKDCAYRYVLTVIDVFSKYAYAVTLRSKSAKEVARAMTTTFRGGRPEAVQTDNGSEFNNSTFRRALGGIKHVNSRPYTPQAQGAVERFNGTLKRHLCSANLKSRGCWCELVAPFLKYYNEERVHSTTGAVPTEIHDPNLRGAELERVQGALERGARRTRMRSNERRLPALRVGDGVRVALTSDAERAKDTAGFRKSTCINWGAEVLTVQRARRDGTYTLEGSRRVYRRQELQRIHGLDTRRGARGRASTRARRRGVSNSATSRNVGAPRRRSKPLRVGQTILRVFRMEDRKDRFVGHKVYAARVKSVEANPSKKIGNRRVVVEYDEAWPDGSITEEMLMRDAMKADREANTFLSTTT